MLFVDGAVYAESAESWASSAETDQVLAAEWTPDEVQSSGTMLVVDGYVGYEPEEGRWQSHHLPNAAIDRALFGSASPDNLADSGSGEARPFGLSQWPKALGHGGIRRARWGSAVRGEDVATHDDGDLEAIIKHLSDTAADEDPKAKFVAAKSILLQRKDKRNLQKNKFSKPGA